MVKIIRKKVMSFLNKFWWHAPEYFNRWRLFPRAFITMYLYIVWSTADWFINLPDPTTQQAGFASAVLGIGAGWFHIYVQGKTEKLQEVRHKSEADGSYESKIGAPPDVRIEKEYEN